MDSDGKTMSNYGLKKPTPQEVFGHWKEHCRRETTTTKNHISIRGDISGAFPGIQNNLEDPGTYYNKTKGKQDTESIYEKMFHTVEGYNSKLHRDDRQHTVGLDIETEEKERPVPIRSSTEYGRHIHKPLEKTNRQYCRIDKVVKGFFKCRGTGIPSSTK